MYCIYFWKHHLLQGFSVCLRAYFNMWDIKCLFKTEENLNLHFGSQQSGYICSSNFLSSNRKRFYFFVRCLLFIVLRFWQDCNCNSSNFKKIIQDGDSLPSRKSLQYLTGMSLYSTNTNKMLLKTCFGGLKLSVLNLKWRSLV